MAIREQDRAKGVDVETLMVGTIKHGDVKVRIFDCGSQPEQY